MRIRALALCVLVCAFAAPDEKIEWLADYKRGLEAAQAAKRPLLLDFWAEW